MQSRHVLFFAALAFPVLLASAQGCSGSVIGAGNDGGEGGTGSTSRAGSTRAASQAQTAQQNVAVSSTVKASGVTAVQHASVQQNVSAQQGVTTGMPSCDQGDCGSCQDCTMQPGGVCSGALGACEANPECITFLDCIGSCPQDNPATPGDEFLECVCTTDGQGGCNPMSAPGTCVGDHPNGLEDYFELANCVFESCQLSCG